MKIKDIKTFCEKLLAAYGVSVDEAQQVIDALIDADLKGLASHGIMRLPIYIKRVKAGIMSPKANLQIISEKGATVVLNANFCFGQIAGIHGMKCSIDRAHKFGIGACLVINSSHFGLAGYYGEIAAAEKMIGIVFSNTTPLMPPTGGAEKKLGNNPLAIVAPTYKNPIVVDMALSAVALGKILVAKNKGEKIPLDWATDKSGNPTSDPTAALEGGMLLPMAGPKGYSLAIAIEILTGIFAGTFAWQIPSLYNLSTTQNIAHFFIAINIENFIDYTTYLERIEEFKAGLKASKKLPGIDEIYLPGEIEQNKAASAGTDIKLPLTVIAELNELANAIGIEPLAVHS